MKMFSLVTMLLSLVSLMLGGFVRPVSAQESAALSLPEIRMSLQQQQASGIKLQRLMLSTNTLSRLLPGEIVVPVGQLQVVGAAQAGLIDALYVAAGQPVKKGQALGHISSPDLLGLQRDYLQSLTQNRLAKNVYERDTELFKDGIIAERRYLSAKSAWEEVNAALRQREQALVLSGMGASAIARLARSGALSNGITITAPMDGQVLEQLVTAGQRIDATTPMFRIGKLDPLWLEMHAPVETFKAIRLGMRVTIPQYQAQGRIIAIIRNINKNDQTMTVRAQLDQHAERLSPGQFVEAEIVMDPTHAQQYAVPKTAVIRHGVATYLFVQTRSGFKALPVKVLSEQGAAVVVSGDVSASVHIAVAGTSAIKAIWLAAGER